MHNVRHQSVAIPGYWRITNFGKLAENPLSKGADPRILVWLGQLRASSDRSGDLRDNQIAKYLPIGEIPRLYLNAVLRDGRLQWPPQKKFNFESTATRTLDLSRGNLKVFDRHEKEENGCLIVPLRDKWKQQPPDANALFVAIGDDGDPYSVIIPSVEIFRFFYATSNVLAEDILTGAFLDPGRRIWNPNMSGISGDGKAVLWLRKRMLDADAKFIARFAFDKYALQEAQQVFLRLAKAGPSQERMINALPPIAEAVKLRFTYCPTEKNRCLVTRIHQCRCVAPFTHLYWDRDNDGRYDPDNRWERSPMDWSPNFVDISSTNAETPDALADQSASLPTPPARLREAEIAERFPGLAEIPAEKLPQSDTKSRSGATDWRTLLFEENGYSVVDGNSSKELIGPAIIEAASGGAQMRERQTSDIDPTVGEKGYLHIFQLLRLIASEGLANVSYEVVLDTYAEAAGTIVNVMPRHIDFTCRAWLFVDEARSAPRFVAVAKVVESDKTKYLIEFQARTVGNKPSTLVLWHPEHEDIDILLIRELILECGRSAEASLADAKFYGLAWGRLKHSTEGRDISAARHYLRRVFSAKPLGGSHPG